MAARTWRRERERKERCDVSGVKRTKLAKVLAVLSGTTLFLVGLSTALVWEGFKAQTAVAESWAERDQAHQIAQELRQSSDDLTRMARTFAVTGDERYRRYYHEILDIRDGELPRPLDYHTIYWDFVTADDAPPRPGGKAVALRTLMEDAGFTASEIALLEASEDESNLLTNMEESAFSAVDEDDLPLAQTILHSAEYHRAKADIMLPIHRFIASMEKRTAARIDRSTARLDDINGYFLATTALLLTLVAIVFVMALMAARHSARPPAPTER